MAGFVAAVHLFVVRWLLTQWFASGFGYLTPWAFFLGFGGVLASMLFLCGSSLGDVLSEHPRS